MNSVRIIPMCIVVAASTLVAVPDAAADVPGFQIASTLQGAPLIVTVSTEGTITSFYADSSQPRQLSRQFLVRYRDRTLWAIDAEHRTYYATNLSAQIAATLASLRRVMNSSPRDGDSKLITARATLRPLPMKSAISGVTISAFLLTMPNQSWRIWIATSLPIPPADIRSSLSQLVPVDAGSEKVLTKMAGYPVVRTEVNNGSGWKPVLDTQTIRPVMMKSTDFVAPTGFSEVAPPSDSRPPGGLDVSANVIRGPGPEMSNPELYVVFWGQALNDPSNKVSQAELVGAMQDIVRPEYIQWLKDYDIRSAKVSGVYHRVDLPPRAVGSSNFPAISAMVYDVGFKEGAPIFWWSVGGHDPLYVLLVTDAEVDKAWDGYHFAAFSLTHAVLPFPASLFAHDAIPWVIAKIPQDAMALSPEARLYREGCMAHELNPALPFAPPVSPAFCSTLSFFDEGTERISHEFVEAASDPFVFFGWSDPTKQPFWKNSEIGDICEGSPLPWGKSTVVGQTSVSTYWSNTARACVPASIPSVTILDPANVTSVSSVNGHVVLRGYARDPVDGVISPFINWTVDGAPLTSINTNPDKSNETRDSGQLSPGYHLVTAVIENSRHLKGTANASFVLNTIAPKVTILSPGQDSQHWSNQQIVFRGQAFAFQPGDVPDSTLQWDDGGAVIGNGPLLFTAAPAIGDHNIRLSVMSNGQPTASATVTIHVAQPGPKTRTPPSVVITSPAPSNNVFAVPYGSDRSAPILFAATIVDANGAAVPASVSWKSDLDGPLGTGPAITTTLRGGYCAPFVHKVTVTVIGPLGGRVADTILLTIGQVC